MGFQKLTWEMSRDYTKIVHGGETKKGIDRERESLWGEDSEGVTKEGDDAAMDSQWGGMLHH